MKFLPTLAAFTICLILAACNDNPLIGKWVLDTRRSDISMKYGLREIEFTEKSLKSTDGKSISVTYRKEKDGWSIMSDDGKPAHAVIKDGLLHIQFRPGGEEAVYRRVLSN